MPIKEKKRKSSNADLQKAKNAAAKPQMHKLSLEVPAAHYEDFKSKTAKDGHSMSQVLRDFIKEY